MTSNPHGPYDDLDAVEALLWLSGQQQSAARSSGAARTSHVSEGRPAKKPQLVSGDSAAMAQPTDSAKPGQVNNRWTDEEIRRLGELLDEGYVIADIAKELGRTWNSVYVKKNELFPDKGATYNKWTSGDIETLKSMLEAGTPIPDIAKALGRSETHIYNKRKELFPEMSTLKKWTPGELETLRSMLVARKSIEEIEAALPGRNHRAIMVKIHSSMGPEMIELFKQSKPKRDFMQWTEEDERTLIQMTEVDDDVKWDDIANTLKRSVGAVKGKYNKLKPPPGKGTVIDEGLTRVETAVSSVYVKTSPPTRTKADHVARPAGRPFWTTGELTKLEEMLVAGADIEEIKAALPGRSLASIKSAVFQKMDPSMRKLFNESKPARKLHSWTPEEEKELIELRSQGHSWAYIAKKLGRSEDSVSTKFLDYQKKLERREEVLGEDGPTLFNGSKPQRQQRRWTPEEETRLIQLRKQGHTWTYIAEQMGRTKDSIKHKFAEYQDHLNHRAEVLGEGNPTPHSF